MTSFFNHLRQKAQPVWHAYTHHLFVEQLGQGTLPKENFQHYLMQDYLFLQQYVRVFALAVYKAKTSSERQFAHQMITALLTEEIPLHVKYCREWNMSECSLLKIKEENATIAYTRFVLEAGMAGDYLDLMVAVAPCMMGYAEIGARLQQNVLLEGHPYRSWIEMYSGKAYQSVAALFLENLEDAYEKYGTAHRLECLERTFTHATSLEIDFWQQGLLGDTCEQ